MTAHEAVDRFTAELRARGGTGEVRVFEEPTHTAAMAAQALGCEVGAIANSLIFAERQSGSGGSDQPESLQPVLILTSGAHRVDTAKVAAGYGLGELTRATPDFVRAHTSQVIGGVSPLGHPGPIRTYLDSSLARYPVIWAAAGHPAAVFSTSYPELLQLTGATEIAVD